MGLYSIIFYHSEKEKSICEGEFKGFEVKKGTFCIMSIIYL